MQKLAAQSAPFVRAPSACRQWGAEGVSGPQHLGRYWHFRERLARFAVAGGEAVVLGPGVRLAAPGARRVVCAGSSSPGVSYTLPSRINLRDRKVKT